MVRKNESELGKNTDYCTSKMVTSTEWKGEIKCPNSPDTYFYKYKYIQQGHEQTVAWAKWNGN